MKTYKSDNASNAVLKLLQLFKDDQELNNEKEVSLSKGTINNVLHLADLHSQRLGHEPTFNWIQKGVMWYSLEVNRAIEKLLEMTFISRFGNAYYTGIGSKVYFDHDISASISAYLPHAKYSPKFLERRINEMRKTSNNNFSGGNIDHSLELYWNEVHQREMEQLAKRPSTRPGFLL